MSTTQYANYIAKLTGNSDAWRSITGDLSSITITKVWCSTICKVDLNYRSTIGYGVFVQSQALRCYIDSFEFVGITAIIQYFPQLLAKSCSFMPLCLKISREDA